MIEKLKKSNFNRDSIFTDFKLGILGFLKDKLENDKEFQRILWIIVDLTKGSYLNI